MKDALRYLNNARGILRHAPREGSIYTDVKYVQEACGTAYLAVLKAIDEYFIARGTARKKLPKSVDEYRKMLRWGLSSRNGKLFRHFDSLYDTLHLAGYYRGFLHDASVVRDALALAEQFICRLK
jgi:hypothetical protein